MAGLVVTVGGRLDASYKYALEQSVIEAKVAAAAMTGEFSKVEGSNMVSAAIAAVNARKISRAGQGSLWKEDSLATGVMLSGFEKQRLAAIETTKVVKAEQLAMLTIVARQGGIGSASGGHGHRYGGRGGVIQEVAVIGHEMLQGRGTGRIIGSISILAGRMGWLGKLVKSTAQEEIMAALAENKLSGAMARTALDAEKKAVATILSAEASGLSKGAALQAAGADLTAAAAARAAAVAQTVKAAATVEAAEIAAASATVALGPIGWLLFAVIAVVGVFFLLARSMNSYAKEQRVLNETLATSATKFSDESAAMEKANSAAIEFEKSLAKLNLRHNQSVEKSDMAVEALKRHADATANLAEEKRKAAMLDIDLAEKQGKIGHIQAIRARADAEKQAVADKAATQISAMKAEVDQRAADSIKGIKDYNAAVVADQEANDAVNKSPESVARMAAANFAKRKKDETDEKVKTAEKALEDEKNSIFGNENMIGVKTYALKQAKEQANFRQRNYDDAQRALSPDEIAAQASSQKASEASSASDNLQKAFAKALVDYNAKVKDSPAAVSAAQANITKQEKIDELGIRPGPQGLNAMQKLGAFTAQGGNPLIDIGRQHTVLLSQILASNKGLKEYQANKQGGVAY